MKKIFVLCMMCCLSTIMLADLSQMEKPWKNPPKRLSLETYIGTLYYYAQTFPDIFKLELVAKSPKGLPVYLCKVTDPTVSDEDKNVILITALHSGAERTATAGLMEFIPIITGKSELAKDSLKKNIILIMPIVSPEGFFLDEALWNSRRFDPYSIGRGNRVDLKTLAPKVPEDAPEYIAFQKVSDKYKPDFHMDVHGTGLHFNSYIQPMTIGRAGSNSSIGLWDAKLQQALMASAPAAGFGAYCMEDAQRLIWGPSMGKHYQSFFDMGQPFYYGATYGYIRNHTMLGIIESTWTFSVTEPLKALLQEANKGFSNGRVNDFKVNLIKGGFNTSLLSYGKTKAERRESRVKLWQKQDYFAVGTSYPNSGNFVVSMIAYGKEGLTTLTGTADSGRWGQAMFADILKHSANYSYIAHEGLAKFFAAAPPNVKKIMFEKGTPSADIEEPELDSGIAIGCDIPIANAEIVAITLNGKAIKPSIEDGYETWVEDGFTHVRVNIPAERTAKEKLFLLGVAWNAPFDIHSKYGYVPDEIIKEFIKNDLSEEARREIEEAKAVQTKHIEDKKKK